MKNSLKIDKEDRRGFFDNLFFQIPLIKLINNKQYNTIWSDYKCAKILVNIKSIYNFLVMLSFAILTKTDYELFSGNHLVYRRRFY